MDDQFDGYIRAARVLSVWERSRAGDGSYGELVRQLPGEITKTERWEWPLISDLTEQGWMPAFDPGRGLFYAEPEFGPKKIPVASDRVVVCGTKADLSVLFEDDQPTHSLLVAAEDWGVELPRFTACSQLASFWPTLMSSRWYLDPLGRYLPALLITTGRMRNYSRLGGETLNVSERLERVAQNLGIGFLTIKA